MTASIYGLIAQLEEQARNRPPPPGSDQVAAVNMLFGPLARKLADMSKAGEQLPESVPGYGALPPGDVVMGKHFTAAPSFQAFDPATWGQRGGNYGNAEAPRMNANPDIMNTQFYMSDYPHHPERELFWRPGTREIEGAIPGMYNRQRDPLNIRQQVLDEYARGQTGRFPGMVSPISPQELQTRIDREVLRRGYTGSYWEDTGQKYGAAGYVGTLVDLTGAAPNIAQMRKDLGVLNAPGEPEVRFAPGQVAAVTTETMPGKAVAEQRYKGYETNPTGAAMLHRDYENLLRTPEGNSLVAERMGIAAPVMQSQGAYKGQRNLMSSQRIPVTQPYVDASASPSVIKKQAQLRPNDKAKLEALAAVEGKLRDQDAVAWSYPIHMVPEGSMSLAGLPWDSVNGAMIRGPAIGMQEIVDVSDDVRAFPLPKRHRWTPGDDSETMEDHIAVVPAPDGQGGVFLLNVGNIPNDLFQDVVKNVQQKRKNWFTYRGASMEWGTGDSGYIEADKYDDTIRGLPSDLRTKAYDTLKELGPMTGEIRRYHDRLRGVGQ